MQRELDFKGKIDETKEILMENGALNMMMFVVGDDLRELVNRSNLLKDLGGITYDEFLKLDGNVQVSVDMQKEPATIENYTEVSSFMSLRKTVVDMTLSYCDENRSEMNYKVRISEDEKQSIINDFKERASTEILGKDSESALVEAKLRHYYKKQITQEPKRFGILDLQLLPEDRMDHLRFYTFDRGQITPILEIDLAQTTSPMELSFDPNPNDLSPTFVGCFDISYAPYLLKTFVELDIAVPCFSDVDNKIIKTTDEASDHLVVVFNPDTMEKLDPIGTEMYKINKNISDIEIEQVRGIYKNMKETYQEMLKEREFLKRLPVSGYDKDKYKKGTTIISNNERFAL